MRQKLNYLLGLGFLMTVYVVACNSDDRRSQTGEEAVVRAPDTSYQLTEVNYLDEGMAIAGQSQAALAQNLISAINHGGTEYAVDFCNMKAIPITDSMGNVLKATVKRVSDKPRNPSNQANLQELEQITRMKQEMKAGEPARPGLIERNGKMIGYYPIVTNVLCTKCHGSKIIEIEQATLRKIHKLYPHDKAIGYKVNELRGMWVVEMDKK